MRVIVVTGVVAACSLSITPSTTSPTAPASAPSTVAFESASTSSGAAQINGGNGVMPAAAITTGQQTVWVSVESVTDATNDDSNSITTAGVQSLIAAMNTYWKAQSSGKVSVVLGGIETRSLSQATCSGSDVFTRAPGVAFDGRFADNAWENTGDHLLVLTREACGGAGIGSVGGDGGVMVSANGTGGTLGVPVALHEFGHNLGFGHAGTSICRSVSASDATSISSFGGPNSYCPTDEYGDYLDIMGYTMSNATPGLSSAQRIRAGYLTAYANVTNATPSITRTITPLSGSGSIRAIRITDPKSGAVYYVEFRAAVGQDASSTAFTGDERCTDYAEYTACSRGLSRSTGVVRILRELPHDGSMTYIRTTVLDMSPVGSELRSDHLDVGNTFVSADSGIWVTVNSVAGVQGASVTVRFSAPAATKTALHAQKKKTRTTTRVKLWAVVTSPSGSAVAGTVHFYDRSRLVGTATVKSNHKASLAFTKVTRGTHRYSAVFVPATGDATASHSASSAVKIAR